METILTDLSKPALSAAVHNNLLALFESFHPLPSGHLEQRQEVTRFSASGILNPMFNGVSRVSVSPEMVDGLIDDTIAYFQSRQIPYWFWWVASTFTQPAGLGAKLVNRGLLPYEVDAPGMAVDLSTINTAVTTPDDFHITEVSTTEDLEAWVKTIIAGMEMPAFAAQSWFDATQKFGIGKTPWRMYIGWLGDEPAAVSMSVLGAGVIGIIAVGVAPEARRKGIGAAITLKPLLDGRHQGYRVGVLFSTEMGFNVYKRLGFQQVCTVSRYLWRQA